MALKNLTTREMAKLGADLVREGSRQRRALEAVPQARGLIGLVEGAHAGVLAAQPPPESELEALTDRIGALDVRHDDIVRGIIDRLASERSLSKVEATREVMRRVLTTILPTGRAIVQRSYLEQAGAGELREARVTEADRAVLAALPTHDGGTLDDRYAELQQVSAEIGALESKRSKYDADGQLLLKNRDARNQWIGVINALADVLAVAGVDEAPILRDIREAAAEAGLRAESGTNTTTTGPTDTGATDVNPTDTDTDTDDEDDALDPPVPTDAEPTET